jgi:hypothetical protein
MTLLHVYIYALLAACYPTILSPKIVLRGPPTGMHAASEFGGWLHLAVALADQPFVTQASCFPGMVPLTWLDPFEDQHLMHTMHACMRTTRISGMPLTNCMTLEMP